MDPRDAPRAHAQTIEDCRRGLADLMVDAHLEVAPGMAERYGAMARRTWGTEALSRIDHLAQAMAVGEPDVFSAHMEGSIAALRARHVADEDIAAHVRTLHDVLESHLPPEAADAARPFVAAAVKAASAPNHCAEPGLLESSSRDATLARLYLLHLLQREAGEALSLAMDARRGGMTLAECYERVLAPALAEVGRMWQVQEASIADEHYCTASTRSIVTQLRAAAPVPPADGRRAICCSVAGDLHDTGSRMAADLLELDGWTVDFLGANVPAAEVVLQVEDAASEPGRGFDLVLAGASTSLSLRAAIDLVGAMAASPVARSVPVLLGGAPFAAHPRLWRSIGAAAGAATLSDAVVEAARLVPAPNGQRVK